MNYNKILSKYKISDKKIKLAHSLIKSINSKLKSDNINAKASLGGSLAKNTYLNNIDLDIFISFNYAEYKNKDISKVLLKFIKKNFDKFQILHGSRDYFQVNLKNELIEFVPVLDIKDSSKAKNITDVSPLHVHYVNNKLKKTDDVKLLKLFFKANNLYGAESYIGGFSGYLSELLIIHYGSFDNLIKAVSKWDKQIVIDIEKYYKSNNEVLKLLNTSKTNGPLIIIDPTQKDRNAATAVSFDMYSKFIHLSRKYLNSKKIDDFFTFKIFKLSDIKKKTKESKTHLLLINYVPKFGLEDIIGSKVKKGYEFIKRFILENDFTIFDSGFHFEKEWAHNKGNQKTRTGVIYFLINESELPVQKKHFGPSIYFDGHQKFIDKYKQVYIEDSKYYTIKDRSIYTFKQLQKEVMSKKDLLKYFEKFS